MSTSLPVALISLRSLLKQTLGLITENLGTWKNWDETELNTFWLLSDEHFSDKNFFFWQTKRLFGFTNIGEETD